MPCRRIGGRDVAFGKGPDGKLAVVFGHVHLGFEHFLPSDSSLVRRGLADDDSLGPEHGLGEREQAPACAAAF